MFKNQTNSYATLQINIFNSHQPYHYKLIYLIVHTLIQNNTP